MVDPVWQMSRVDASPCMALTLTSAFFMLGPLQ
jgi:hypothetical protein